MKLKRVISPLIREAVVLALLKSLAYTKAIVFFKTKRQCHKLAIVCKLEGIAAIELHGNLT